MTQTVQVIEALALIAVTWLGPVAALALIWFGYKRSQVRFHVGTTNPRVRVPAQTFRTKAAARRAANELAATHGARFRITTTR